MCRHSGRLPGVRGRMLETLRWTERESRQESGWLLAQPSAISCRSPRACDMISSQGRTGSGAHLGRPAVYDDSRLVFEPTLTPRELGSGRGVQASSRGRAMRLGWHPPARAGSRHAGQRHGGVLLCVAGYPRPALATSLREARVPGSATGPGSLPASDPGG